MSEPSVEVIANDIHYIRRDVEEIKSSLEREYVTQDQFQPIQKIVYGMVSIVLTASLVGMLALWINK